MVHGLECNFMGMCESIDIFSHLSGSSAMEKREIEPFCLCPTDRDSPVDHS